MAGPGIPDAKWPALRERPALCFKELLDPTLGGPLSSTRMSGPVLRTMPRNPTRMGGGLLPACIGSRRGRRATRPSRVRAPPIPFGWKLRFDRASSGIPLGNCRHRRLRLTRGRCGLGTGLQTAAGYFLGASSTDCGREPKRIFDRKRR